MYYVIFFCYVLCQDFYLLLAFNSLTTMCLNMFFLVFILVGVFYVSVSFIKFEGKLAIIA